MGELSQDRWLLFLDRAKSLRAYIRRRVDDPTEAEEVFQDLSLIVLRHRSGPKEIERFNAWCHSLARHVLAHHFRTKRRRANLLSRVEFESAGFETSHRVDPERAAARLTKFVGLGLDTVFWINSGAEANENALKLAFKLSGRSKIVALEQGWHGRTAAAGAVTWGALEKWYGFPRTPFDVSFAPRDNPAAVEDFVDRETAAVIVEPVQGVGGAYDVGARMLEALRRRCDEVGALLIFDEVQCGMGRTGAPFAANFYGVAPDMLTAAKALGNGFPVSALLLSRRVAGQLKYDDMGTTFGGGPMACAVTEAVIDTIESESLLANVRQVSAYIRSSCIIGPVTGLQGAGFLLGLKTSRPAKEVQAALLAKNILTGTSADPHILRLLPAYILNEGHVDQLSDALARISA